MMGSEYGRAAAMGAHDGEDDGKSSSSIVRHFHILLKDTQFFEYEKSLCNGVANETRIQLIKVRLARKFPDGVNFAHDYEKVSYLYKCYSVAGL